MNIDLNIFKIQSNNVLPSRGKILISEPFLRDVTFGRSVILLVDHTEEGSMGLVINKLLPLLLNEIIMEFKYLNEIPLYKGGPVATDTLFYLHTLTDIPGSISLLSILFIPISLLYLYISDIIVAESVEFARKVSSGRGVPTNEK